MGTGDLTFRLEIPRRFTGSAEVAIGQTTVLAGASGAGKSTLLMALAGLLPDCRGEIRFAGATWLDSAAGNCLPACQRPTALAFQGPQLLPHLSVAANLTFAEQRAKAHIKGPAKTELIDALDLDGLLNKRPAMLSGGEQKRAAIAQTMLARPQLLLLDEPFGGLDLSRRQRLRHWLVEWLQRYDLSAIIATHDIDDMLMLADHALWLDQGSVQRHGPIADVVDAMLGPQSWGEAARTPITSVVPAEITGSPDDWGMLDLRVAGQRLSVPGDTLIAGARASQSRVLVRIDARDVALANSPVGGISMRNQLTAIIARIAERPGSAYALVTCHLREQSSSEPVAVHAWVTRKSIHDLGLNVQSSVILLIKAISFDHEPVR